MKQAPKNQTKEFNVNKLQKLHDRFEVVAREIESTEDKINECIDKDRDTSQWDHKLEKLQDKEYEIQCKIEELENQPIEYISCGTHHPEYDAYCDHKYGGNACTTKGGVR